YLEIINEKGDIIGLALRSEVHGNPLLMHRVVHVLVFNEKGEILLQKRSNNKDVAPGKWDTSVGGHVNPGEDLISSAIREMNEELGILKDDLKYLYSYVHTNLYETEHVTTFGIVHDGGVSFNREEIEEVRFWSIEEIKKCLGTGILSDNFEQEIDIYLSSLNPSR
ncbi:MAG: NUDIX hydrolase, partial [Thermodesulfovibrionales bacterium]